jgi:enoyl-CoA hydratase
MISPSERVHAEVDGHIGWMVFDNPARRNALSLDMWAAIPVILDAFEADPQVRVVVLKGAGDVAFISGADISQFEQHRASAEASKDYDRTSDGAGKRLQMFAKPTIAMIRGFCLGGGVGVALGCDLRIASDTARFGIPAARLGVSYRWKGIKRLVELVGPAFAKEIFYTARQFSAVEAERMGLINRLLPDGELESFVRDYCRMISENAPLTIAATKGVIAELAKPGAEIDARHCEELIARCFASEDYVEGRRAFMEKRKPAFAGK